MFWKMAAIQNSQAAKQRKVRKANFAASELAVLTEEVEEVYCWLIVDFKSTVGHAEDVTGHASLQSAIIPCKP